MPGASEPEFALSGLAGCYQHSRLFNQCPRAYSNNSSKRQFWVSLVNDVSNLGLTGRPHYPDCAVHQTNEESQRKVKVSIMIESSEWQGHIIIYLGEGCAIARKLGGCRVPEVASQAAVH